MDAQDSVFDTSVMGKYHEDSLHYGDEEGERSRDD